jgi:hypothetical protein
MKATGDRDPKEVYAPDEDDDWAVVIVEYDEFKPPSSDEYILAPYKYEEKADIPPPPDKPNTSYTVFIEDEETLSGEDLRGEDAPDWVEQFETE